MSHTAQGDPVPALAKPRAARVSLFLSRGFSEKRDFSSLQHEGRPGRKHVGVEFDTPESHERMHGCRPRRALPKKGAAVAKLGGLHMMERRVEPTSRAGLGKHGKTSLLFLFFCPGRFSLFLTVLFSQVGVPTVAGKVTLKTPL